MELGQGVEDENLETSDETPLASNSFFFQFSGINNTKLSCLQCDHNCHSMVNNKPALFDIIVETKQISNNGFYAQNIRCSCCKTFCHKIYTQPAAARSSKSGETEAPNDNPDLADIFL